MPATATARAELEALLRTRKLDRTVTRADALPAQGVVSTGVAALDESLGGGLPRGELSEIVGPRSSGRSSVLAATLAAVTAKGEFAALVDTLDMCDAESGAKAGIQLDRLLWIRGDAMSRHPGAGYRVPSDDVHVEAGSSRPGSRHVEAGVGRPRPRSLAGERLAAADPWARALDRAVKAVNLVLQAGGFDLVALDLAEVLPDALRRLPFTTWFRLQRTLEGSRTACVLVAPVPIARSAGGVTVALSRGQFAGSRQGKADAARGVSPVSGDQPPARWSGRPGEVRLLLGTDVEARIVRSRDAAGGVCRFAVKA